jgi:hypothetical protein
VAAFGLMHFRMQDTFTSICNFVAEKCPSLGRDWGICSLEETLLEEHLQSELGIEGLARADGWVAEVRSDGGADGPTLTG